MHIKNYDFTGKIFILSLLFIHQQKIMMNYNHRYKKADLVIGKKLLLYQIVQIEYINVYIVNKNFFY